jgi:hypothetical protein
MNRRVVATSRGPNQGTGEDGSIEANQCSEDIGCHFLCSLLVQLLAWLKPLLPLTVALEPPSALEVRQLSIDLGDLLSHCMPPGKRGAHRPFLMPCVVLLTEVICDLPVCPVTTLFQAKPSLNLVAHNTAVSRLESQCVPNRHSSR